MAYKCFMDRYVNDCILSVEAREMLELVAQAGHKLWELNCNESSTDEMNTKERLTYEAFIGFTSHIIDEILEQSDMDATWRRKRVEEENKELEEKEQEHQNPNRNPNPYGKWDRTYI